METIASLKRKIKAIQKKQNDLMAQECELEREICDLERDRRVDKIRKGIRAGDVKVINEGITDYHCDAMKVYEIISVSERVNKCKRNGVPSTYVAFNVNVRIFTIHAYDGDRYSCIETKQCVDFDALLKAKKMKKDDFEDFKSTVLLDPKSYDGSKWNPKNGAKS